MLLLLLLHCPGESAVGKSSLVLRFVKDQFDDYRESTIGGEFTLACQPACWRLSD